ncbi:MAG TPA: hypothetical protein VN811_12850, partial [Thermoanaerobaculia bacterium]|nr:hypothetical protein [Thermoanaerobaculia bacterium]
MPPVSHWRGTSNTAAAIATAATSPHTSGDPRRDRGASAVTALVRTRGTDAAAERAAEGAALARPMRIVPPGLTT